MLFRQVLVLRLTTKLEPDGNEILEQLLHCEVEISGSRQARGVESLEPRAKAPGQGSAVELGVLVESIDSGGGRTQHCGHAPQLRHKVVVRDIAMMNLKFVVHAQEA